MGYDTMFPDCHVLEELVAPVFPAVQKVAYGTTVQVQTTVKSETSVINCHLTMASYPTGLNFGLHVIWH
jgi:hypothetical protein